MTVAADQPPPENQTGPQAFSWRSKEMAMIRIAAIGAAAAAAVGVLVGGAMRPDAEQFTSVDQQTPTDSYTMAAGEPAGWTRSGPVPDYVMGTDAKKMMAGYQSAYAGPSDAALYTQVSDRKEATDLGDQPDTRPSLDDRAEAIRQAQASGPPVTAPPPNPANPASFPSVDGDTMSGLRPGSVAGDPAANLDGLGKQISHDDVTASKRIAPPPPKGAAS
jgi:hypothetical protein